MWKKNEIPPEWIQTTQIPIPKKINPKSTAEYRKITLCDTIYKIYAKFILDQLTNYMEEISLYQAGFQANRSTDDQIFVLKSVLDERWRKGKKSIILSLDLRQAFDRLKLNNFAKILINKNIPHSLINRIISACLSERTNIQWFGQTTESVQKTRGVKQGCPISPFLFTIALHSIIERTVSILGNYNIQGLSMDLPMILAYADDLIILSESISELNSFLSTFIPLADTLGQELNEQKCEI